MHAEAQHAPAITILAMFTVARPTTAGRTLLFVTMDTYRN